MQCDLVRNWSRGSAEALDCPVALDKSRDNPEACLYGRNNNNKNFTVAFRIKQNDILFTKLY